MRISETEMIAVQDCLIKWRSARPVLHAQDKGWNGDGSGCVPQLAHLLLGEIGELRIEIIASDLRTSNIFIELVDILIFLLAGMDVLDIDLTYPTVEQHELTQALLSRVDDLADQALVLSGGVTPRRLQVLLQTFFVIALSLPDDKPIGLWVKQTVKKNGQHRPRDYYQNQDSQGERLSAELMHNKYIHTEKCMRLIRNYFRNLLGKTPLYQWMHEPFKQLILDFQNSEQNLALLQLSLQNSLPVYAEMFKKIIMNPKLFPDIQDHELKLLSQLAGAVVFPEPHMNS